MSTVTVYAREMVMTEGTSNKYWRALHARGTVATHYGRRGSLGQVTVHHTTPAAAEVKFEDLLTQKYRKGYEYTPGSRLAFDVPVALLDAASSTNSTGRGGSHAGLAHALVAYYLDAAARAHVTLAAGDPMQAAIAEGRLTAQRIAVGALAGYAVTDPALLTADPEELAVMAGLIALDGDLPRPVDLLV